MLKLFSFAKSNYLIIIPERKFKIETSTTGNKRPLRAKSPTQLKANSKLSN